MTAGSAYAEVIEFEVVDPNAMKGDYMSAEDPGTTVWIKNPTPDLEMLVGADEEVINESAIRILYGYVLETTGPSEEEKCAGGWIFKETAPNGVYFTRRDLILAISERYNAIYREDDNSNKYGVWGRSLGDLVLVSVDYDTAQNYYTLDIES